MWKYWVVVALVILAVVVMMSGCSQQPAATATPIEDKMYPVIPASVTVKAGIVAGEITDMKVTETSRRATRWMTGPDLPRQTSR